MKKNFVKLANGLKEVLSELVIDSIIWTPMLVYAAWGWAFKYGAGIHEMGRFLMYLAVMSPLLYVCAKRYNKWFTKFESEYNDLQKKRRLAVVPSPRETGDVSAVKSTKDTEFKSKCFVKHVELLLKCCLKNHTVTFNTSSNGHDIRIDGNDSKNSYAVYYTSKLVVGKADVIQTLFTDLNNEFKGRDKISVIVCGGDVTSEALVTMDALITAEKNGVVIVQYNDLGVWVNSLEK